MILPGVLRRFAVQYRLPWLDRAKLAALYPVFKVHYWYYRGSPRRRRLASRVFALLERAPPVSVSMFFPARGRHVRVPLWLVPDRLTSFQEIFWGETYALPKGWAPDVLVDAGANVGYALMYFAAHCPIREALAIEANPALLRCLRTTAERVAESGVRVEVVSCALVGRARTVRLVVSEHARDSHIDEADRHAELGVLVPGRTLGEWGLPGNRGRVLLKMDIEGAEHEILRDDPRAFRAVDLVVLEIHGPSAKRHWFVQELARRCGAEVLDRRVSCAAADVEVALAEIGAA